MFHQDNFISFHDLSPEARFLWLSPSVHDILGYAPDELVGVPVYNILYTKDIAGTRVAHKKNVLNDFVASQTTLRYVTKDGHAVPIIVVSSLCYDFIVNCSTVVHPNRGTNKQLRSHATAMARLVGSRKEEFERIKRHHEAFASNKWDLHRMEPELRVCMILNRFMRNLIIMYASSACERVFDVDPDHIVGKSILLFIRADDIASFVEQMDMTKASTAISHTRFWFQSPRLRQEIPCETIVYGAADGMVAVMRRCHPFIRKRFIESRDHYREVTSAVAKINNSRSHGSSWTSASSASSSSVPSVASFLSMSPLLPPQDQQHVVVEDDSNTATSLPCNVPMSKISHIQILDLDQTSINNSYYSSGNSKSSSKRGGAHDTRSNTLPLEIPKDDPLLVEEGPDLPETFGVKMYNVQEFVEEQDGDNNSRDDIDDYGGDCSSRSDTRQELDMDMD
ncbi:hypothetical protein BGZ99_000737, partial [Dissophora globulifera]